MSGKEKSPKSRRCSVGWFTWSGAGQEGVCVGGGVGGVRARMGGGGGGA